ncbi:tetratricopeptide repeat protein [Duganella sp. PWIR1]
MMKILTAAILMATSALLHAAAMDPAPLNCSTFNPTAKPTPLADAERALQAARGDSLAEANAMYVLAEAKYFSRDPAGGDAMIKQANAIWNEQPATVQLAVSLQSYARKLIKLNNCALASPLLHTTLSIAERAPESDEALVYGVLSDLMQVEVARRNVAAVTQNAPRLLAYWQRNGDPADSIAAPVYRRMIDLYYKDAQYTLAEPLATRNLNNGEQRYGAGHAALIERLLDLASVYYGQLRYAEGEAAFMRAAAISAKVDPRGATRFAPGAQQQLEDEMRRRYNQGDTAGALALGEQEVRQLAQALEADMQALQVATTARDAQPPGPTPRPALVAAALRARIKVASSEKALAAMRVRVAEILHAQQRYDQAQALYLQALDGYARYGADPLETAAVKSDLAMLYRARGNDTAALPLQAESFEILLLAYGISHPDVVDSAGELAAIYKRQGKKAELAALVERVPALRVR